MRTILIADEEEKIRHLVRFAFTEDMGYRVISASSGIDAVTKIKEYDPEVVICNVSVSGKDGYEISREIKSGDNADDVYIILISNPNSYSDIRAKESKADDVIIIPPDSTNIIGEIGERLETLFKPRRMNLRSPLILIPIILTFLIALSLLLYRSSVVSTSRASLTNKISGLFHPNNQYNKMGEIVITISENGEIAAELVDKKVIQLEELKALLVHPERKDKGNNEEKTIVVRVNSSVPYEFISQAMKLIKLMGGDRVNLITETSSPFELRKIEPEEKYIDGVSPISKMGQEKKKDNFSEKDLLWINVSYANIRSGPGMNYTILTKAPRSHTLYNLNDESGSWIKVRTKDGVEGWISKNLVKHIHPP